jgi:hypothetical protein
MPPTFPHAYLFHEVSIELATAKRAAGRCVSWRCRRRAEVGKSRCPTCRSRLYRINHDDRYAYSNLRASARKRGIGFDLTFEEFREFCRETGYLESRGKDPTSLTIDRRKTDLPYCKGNIRIMNYHDNTSHRFEEVGSPSEAACF